MTPQLSHWGVGEKLETPGAVVQKVEAVPLRLWADAMFALNARTPAANSIVNVRVMTFLVCTTTFAQRYHFTPTDKATICAV